MDDVQAAKLRALAERARGNNIGAVSAMATLGGEYEAILALLDERDAAMALLRRWDALIAHQYTGSRAAMDAMHQCAQGTRALLGDGGEG